MSLPTNTSAGEQRVNIVGLFDLHNGLTAKTFPFCARSHLELTTAIVRRNCPAAILHANARTVPPLNVVSVLNESSIFSVRDEILVNRSARVSRRCSTYEMSRHRIHICKEQRFSLMKVERDESKPE